MKDSMGVQESHLISLAVESTIEGADFKTKRMLQWAISIFSILKGEVGVFQSSTNHIANFPKYGTILSILPKMS